MRTFINVLSFATLIFIFSNTISFAQDTSYSKDSLELFSRLIDGKWYMKNSYQTFEWRVDRKIVKARSYIIEENEERLVSEGFWFKHPETNLIKGYFFAVNMPIEFFDYTTKIENNKMINNLVAYTKEGQKQEYIEIWEFISENKYLWSLNQKSKNGMVTIMQDEYLRK